MKKSLFLFSILLILTTSVFGQRKHKKKKAKENESSIYVSGLLNIDPEEFIINQSSLNTFTGGMATQLTERSYLIPRNVLNIGFSFQKLNANKTYLEITLNRLTFSKRDNITTNTFISASEMDVEITSNLSNKIWDIQTRYEYGKYFISDKNNKINIGAAIAAEPSFLYSNIDPKISNAFPVKAYRTRLHLTIIPVAAFNITSNFALAIKVTPNIFNIEWNRVRTENPILIVRQRIENDFDTSFFNNNATTNIIARFRISSGEGKKKGKSR